MTMKQATPATDMINLHNFLVTAALTAFLGLPQHVLAQFDEPKNANPFVDTVSLCFYFFLVVNIFCNFR